MRQKILKPAPYNFRVQWDSKQYEKDIIELNFEPLIKEYNLTGNFVLLHWQSKPVGLRRWGVYDGITDQYYGVDWNKLDCSQAATNLKILQINELKWIHIRPTAAICLDNAFISYSNEKILIKSENQFFS